MYSLKLYFRHPANLVLLGLSLGINLFVWLWLIIYIRPQTEPIFLHYNVLFGVDYIDTWWKIYYLPLFGFLTFLLNTVLSWLVAARDKFLPFLINATTLFCQTFLLMAALLLVFLNV
jgi:hypothetical protein